MVIEGSRLRLGLLLVVILLPAPVFAQSEFTGLVTDGTGAVLPGVVVEAASPVLIEKVRTATTDASGRYRVLDLRPGSYVLTFTLAGFATVSREGVVLPASFTATVNAEMRVGSIEETITVSGAAPTVDVENVNNVRVLSDDVIDALPGNKMPYSYAQYLPGVTGGVLGAVGRDARSNAIHGTRGNEANVSIAGSLSKCICSTGGGADTFFVNPAIVEELVIELGSITAERQTSGVVSNIIPKEGSNNFSGYFFASYTGDGLQANNLSDEAKARGFAVGGVRNVYEVIPAVGGRLIRDRLWFYSAFRKSASSIYIPNLYYNKTPQGWTYTPDLERPAYLNNRDNDYNTRLTLQVTPRNKVSVYWDIQPHYIDHRPGQGTVAQVTPEAAILARYLPNSFGQLVWKSTVTSRLLLEAASARHAMDFELGRQAGVTPDTWSARETTTGITFRAAHPSGQSYGHTLIESFDHNASATYIAGAHAIKAGFGVLHGTDGYLYESSSIGVSLTGGQPRQLTLSAHPLHSKQQAVDLGLFAQDRWKKGRLSVDLGVRFDYYNSSVPAQEVPAGLFVPARSYAPVADVPSWHDASPRLGVAFDLFGNGKTAVKASLGRFLAGLGTLSIASANNPVNALVTSTVRNWTDANGDFVPDCDLRNPLRNGECEQNANLNFGQPNARATQYDADYMRGSGKRGYNWETTAVLQHELISGVAVELGYYRRSFGNFSVTDNVDVTPSDFEQYCITVPTDARLPNGGGNQLCGLYDVSRARFGLVQNLVRLTTDSENRTEVYDGVDLVTSARFRNGLYLSGGLNTGRTAISSCYVVDSPQQNLFCDVAPPFTNQVKFFGSYPLPWWDVQVAAVFQSIPGPEITASFTPTTANVLPTLGRPLNSSTTTVPLISPGTLYGDRSNQMDLRLSKSVRVRNTRVTGSIDVFNLFNASGIQAVNTTYGPLWQQATGVQGARYVQFSAQMTF